MSISARNLMLAGVLALFATPTMAAATTALPGGATSLNEVHGDWAVQCGTRSAASGGGVACEISQRQLEKTSKKRILYIALRSQPDGGVKGSLVLPLGLALEPGVTMQIDSGPVTTPSKFSVCVAAGCVIPLEWPTRTVDALRSSAKLKIVAQDTGGKKIPLEVSLTGFASALDRAIALAKTN